MSDRAVLIGTLLVVAAGLAALLAGYYVLAVRIGGGAFRARDGLRWLAIGAAFTISLNIVFAGAIIAVNAAVPAAVLHARITDMIHKGQIVAERLTPTSTGHLTDRWSDCLGLSLNIVGPIDRGPVQLFRDSDVVGSEAHPCTSLVALAGPNASDVEVNNYIRYWHGYQLLTKPLVLLLPLSHMRALADVVYLLSVVIFFLTIMSPRGANVGRGRFGGGFILLTGAADEASAMLHNVALAATFLGGIGVHYVARTRSFSATFITALTAAAWVGFLDLIFVPPLVPMVLAMAVFSALVQSGRDDTPALALGFCTALVAWMVGYLGTMALRVVASALLLPDDGAGARSFLVALLFRLNGVAPSAEPGRGFFTPLLRNVSVLQQSPFFFATIAAVAIIVLLRLALGWWRWQPRIAGFFLLPAALPFVWYQIFRNHSEIHNFFTYVWAAFALICASTGLLLSFSKDSEARRKPGHPIESRDAAPRLGSYDEPLRVGYAASTRNFRPPATGIATPLVRRFFRPVAAASGGGA